LSLPSPGRRKLTQNQRKISFSIGFELTSVGQSLRDSCSGRFVISFFSCLSMRTNGWARAIGSPVHVARACARSRKRSSHFESYVRSLSLYFCKRLFSGVEPMTSWSQGNNFTGTIIVSKIKHKLTIQFLPLKYWSVVLGKY
jgi:hypothetical protein